jgi:hypothetical protein
MSLLFQEPFWFAKGLLVEQSSIPLVRLRAGRPQRRLACMRWHRCQRPAANHQNLDTLCAVSVFCFFFAAGGGGGDGSWFGLTAFCWQQQQQQQQ